ncbi:MAG TPA: glycosyltransferase, partial [Victivallales bacterium]|nr:glycosyltransferase [Victivallales bacterium]
NTKEIVEDYQNKDKRIKYIYQNNSSQAVARNKGISLSQGEYIAFLDADDVWLENKLEEQIPILIDESTVLVYSDFICVDENDNILKTNERKKFLRGKVFQDLIYDNFVATSSVLIKKKSITDNKLYFRENRQGVEDWDLWLRLAKIGNFDYANTPLIKYRTYPGNMSSKIEKMHQSRIKTLDDLNDSVMKDEALTNKKRFCVLDKIRKGKAFQTLRTGHEYLALGEKSSAREMFFYSLNLNPLSPRPIWGLIKSFF